MLYEVITLNQKGNNPKSEKKIQVNVTTSEPSRLPISGTAFLPRSIPEAPVNAVIPDVIRK